MSPDVNDAQPASRPADDVEREIVRISVMNIAQLRLLWSEFCGADPPAAFSKDLLARAIAYRLQEQVYGGLKPQTLRLLRTMAKPGAEPPRQVKIGSVIMREHKGVLHEVMVVPGGFCWRGQTYASLSTIAKKITGVNWNGPRFFGLRSKAGAIDGASAETTTGEQADDRRQEVSDRKDGASQTVRRPVGDRRPGGRRSSIGGATRRRLWPEFFSTALCAQSSNPRKSPKLLGCNYSDVVCRVV